MTTTEFRTSVEISPDLRRLIYAARTSPGRWPGGRLTQDDVAARTGLTPTWYRKIEKGSTGSASLATVCDICQVLGIDPYALQVLGYDDLAAELTERRKLGTQVVVDLDDLGVLTEAERKALEIILAKIGFSGGWRKKEKEMFA